MEKIFLIFIITINLALINSCSIGSLGYSIGNSRTKNENNYEYEKIDTDMKYIFDFFNDEVISSEKATDNTLKNILDAIIDEDEESIKDIFSEQVLEEDENFDTEMNYIFDFFNGEVISSEYYSGPIVDEQNNYGAIVKDMKSFYNVETEEGNYIVFILEYTEDTDNPENIGVYALRIIRAEDKETEFTYWQDMAIPGIYMPEK